MIALEYVQNASKSLPLDILPSNKVYKDDCMYSFDTAENNFHGLDVCMSCFQAFSRSDHRNWTKEHYDKKRHPLFLNIVKTLKPQRDRPSPFLLLADTRLPKAPKLEIFQQTDEDLYDTSTKIYVAPLDEYVEIDQCPESVVLLASKVLSANSANTDNDIAAWEQEIFPCEHSSSVDKEGDKDEVSGKIDTSKCSACDLESNLWVCLTCGAVCCGREQFGSDIKGNSHALAHFELSGHAVAAKLGSLSSDEGKCDCYCYKCNDEVKVPGLSSKLSSFGIDLNQAVKSEKSLVELNLETNKNWQFNLDGNDGEKLSPVFGPGLTGMKNLGNTCYINSIIQALFNLTTYKDFFASRSFDGSILNPAEDLESQLIKLYDGLTSGRYSKPSGLKGDLYQEGIRPDAFKALIGGDHPEFRTNKQQDANEFLLYLFDKLDKEFGLELNRDFKFVMGSKLVCTNCHTGSMSNELVDTVSIPIRVDVTGETEDGKKVYVKTTFEESFSAFTAREEIEGYLCDVCGQKTKALKQTGLRTYPKYLMTSLQRIQLENWTPIKVEVPIDIPSQIDLSPFQTPLFGENETEVKINNSGPEFKPDQESMMMLESMGFSEQRSIRALYNTDNKGAEEAMNWIFAHMDDGDIDTKFVVPSASSESGSEPEILQEAVDNLTAMGFAAHLARKALHLHSGNPNSAVDWLFNNPDDDGVIDTISPKVDIAAQYRDLKEELLSSVGETSTQYQIKAVICHKGSSPHTGHYVVFIKMDGRWVLFNDEKVVDCGDKVEEIRTCGYIYLFERV